MSNKQILNLIKDYQNDVKLFMKLFNEKYARKDIIRAWHDGDIPQNGKVTDTIEYELHGIGCCVFFPDREIDFDFGPNLRTDGFDLWRLKQYIKQNTNPGKYPTNDELEVSFNQLAECGAIKKIYENSNLYFFNDDI